jgi:stage IV sporulation protein FB
MLITEPRPSRLDLHGRLLGADLRIRPMFWASTVLLGIIFYQDPEVGGVAMFGFWILAVLFSLLFHEFCHILAARLLGGRVRIVLAGLGGQVYGLEEMKRWRRVLILWSGSLGNVLLCGILWAIADPHWNPLPIARLGPKGAMFLVHAVEILMLINAVWALLNVLPLWPLDGGRVAVELGDALLGRRGQILALILSLAVCLFMSFEVVRRSRPHLADPFDIRYILHLLLFGIQLLYCYIFWLCTFRALWGESTPLDELSRPGRAA